jgi:hypothetical protein
VKEAARIIGSLDRRSAWSENPASKPEHQYSRTPLSVVAEEHGEIGEWHLELLRVTADLARNDPAAVAQMYTAVQRMNLNTVGKQADKAEFIGPGTSPQRAAWRCEGWAWRQATGCSASLRKGIGSLELLCMLG